MYNYFSFHLYVIEGSGEAPKYMTSPPIILVLSKARAKKQGTF